MFFLSILGTGNSTHNGKGATGGKLRRSISKHNGQSLYPAVSHADDPSHWLASSLYYNPKPPDKLALSGIPLLPYADRIYPQSRDIRPLIHCVFTYGGTNEIDSHSLSGFRCLHLKDGSDL